jgi:hypothetical protein
MEVSIRIEDGSPEDLTDLTEWLGGENELRGRCHIVRNAISDTELGSVPDLLMVALGSGGAGTVLASSLITWLQTRKTRAKITVVTTERSISLDIEATKDVVPMLEQILRMSGDS